MITFTDYFAQAPYTEAAIVPIFTAINVLDYDGYMNNLKGKPLNINEVFKDLGYKTYNNFFFYANSLSFLRGVDEYDYIGTQSITYYVKKYRISYFQKLYTMEIFQFKIGIRLQSF